MFFTNIFDSKPSKTKLYEVLALRIKLALSTLKRYGFGIMLIAKLASFNWKEGLKWQSKLQDE